MPVPSFCKNCIYFERLATGVKTSGICQSTATRMMMEVEGENLLATSHVIWLDEYFGCGNFRSTPLTLVDTTTSLNFKQ